MEGMKDDKDSPKTVRSLKEHLQKQKRRLPHREENAAVFAKYCRQRKQKSRHRYISDRDLTLQSKSAVQTGPFRRNICCSAHRVMMKEWLENRRVILAAGFTDLRRGPGGFCGPAPVPEEETTTVAAHTRRHSHRRQLLPDNLPQAVHDCPLTEEELRCPECGRKRVEIGVQRKKQLTVIPAMAESGHILFIQNLRGRARNLK